MEESWSHRKRWMARDVYLLLIQEWHNHNKTWDDWSYAGEMYRKPICVSHMASYEKVHVYSEVDKVIILGTKLIKVTFSKHQLQISSSYLNLLRPIHIYIFIIYVRRNVMTSERASVYWTSKYEPEVCPTKLIAQFELLLYIFLFEFKCTGWPSLFSNASN